MRLVAGLQRLLDLRQHLLRQLQQDFALGGEAQGLALAHEQFEAQTLFKIAELVRQGRLRLMKLGRRPASEPLLRRACSVRKCFSSIMRVLHIDSE